MNPLKRLRKYRAAVTGALLPVLAFVWIGAAASPCGERGRGGRPVGEAAHAASLHGVALSRDANGTNAAAVMADEHEHSAAVMTGGHEHSAAMTDGHEHSRPDSAAPCPLCPHCPPGHSHTGSHVVCATLSAFAAGNDSTAAPAYDLGQALPALLRARLDEHSVRPRGVRPPYGYSVPPPSIPLNLRHCTFLN